MLWFGSLVLSIALISHGDCRDRRTVRGHDVAVEEFPYQASIQKADSRICNGAIISEKHILTVGHRVFLENPPFELLYVITGSTYSGQIHEIAKITIHPEFRFENSRYINDIAVIELKDPIVFDASQQKINLPKQNFKVGQKVNLTGWHYSSKEPLDMSEVLQTVETNILSTEECKKAISVQRIYDTEVCVRTIRDNGVCKRDSGSPLAINGEVVGIASSIWTRNRQSVCGHTVVNSNVYKLKDFIESAMK